jgi:hypothetical protein
MSPNLGSWETTVHENEKSKVKADFVSGGDPLSNWQTVPFLCPHVVDPSKAALWDMNPKQGTHSPLTISLVTRFQHKSLG